MSLTKCLAKAGKAVDAGAIRAARDAYLGDGMSHKEAATAAAQDYLDSLVAERADLASRVETQGGALDALPETPGTEAEEAPTISFSRAPPRMGSKLADAIRSSNLKSAKAPQWLEWIKNSAPKAGVKADEIEWSGVLEALALDPEAKFTREELADMTLRSSRRLVDVDRRGYVKVDEALARQQWANIQHDINTFLLSRVDEYYPADIDVDDEFFDFHGDILSGEVVLNEDDRAAFEEMEAERNRLANIIYENGSVGERRSSHENWTLKGGENYREILVQLSGGVKFDGVAGHFGGAKNILVSLRAKDRVSADGRPVFFLEEVQSDWAQRGRDDGFEDKNWTLADERRLTDLRGQLRNALRNDPSLIRELGYAHSPGVGLDALVEALEPTNSQSQNEQDVLLQHPLGAEGSEFMTRLREYRDLVRIAPETVNFTTSVQRGPFVTDTKAWVTLGLKQAILEAVDGGHKVVAWTTGEQQADRYSLEQRVGGVYYAPEGVGVGKGTIIATKPGKTLGDTDSPFHEQDNVAPEDLPAIIGKDLADKLISAPTDGAGFHVLEGGDLRVGGSGMREFYDRILPRVANDLVKKYGARVGPVEMGLPGSEGKGKYIGETYSLDELRDMLNDPEDIEAMGGRTDEGHFGEGRVPLALREIRASMLFDGRSFEDSLESVLKETDSATADRLVRFLGARWEKAPAAVQQGFEITPALREAAVSGGMPMFSRRSRAPQRLPIPGQGSVQAGRPASAMQTGRKLKLHEKVGKAISSPLTGILDEREYRSRRGLIHGKMAELDTVSRMIVDLFNHGSKADRTAAYEYLNDPRGDETKIVDPEVRALAVDVKNAFVELGQKAVDMGTLSQQAYDHYKGGYLPRLYLRHLMPDGERAAIAAGKQGNFGWAKQRKDIDDYTRQFLLGEIKEPGFLAGKGFATEAADLHFLDFMQSISENPNWAVQDDFLDYELGTGTPHARTIRTTTTGLMNRAEELEAMAAQMPDGDAQVALDEAREMRKAIAAHRDQLSLDPREVDIKKYKQIPKSKRYGNLAGMWVLKEIHEDLVNIGATESMGSSWVERAAHPTGWGQKAVRAWKTGKVIYNPGSQVRNFVSNGVLLHLAGVPFIMVPVRAAQAALALMGKGRYARFHALAKKHGLTHTTFALQEIGKFDVELLESVARSNGQASGTRIGAAMKRMGMMFHNAATGLYQGSEAFWKIAAMIDAIEGKKMSAEDAAIFANDALFDYTDVGNAVNIIRKSPFGAPFITFQVKAAARMAENLTDPIKAARFLPYVAILYGLQSAVAESLDVDEDDLEKLRKALPQWLQDRGHTLIWPWKDDNGKWQIVDLSYFVPWAQLASAAKSAATGEVGGVLRETGLLGGPALSLASAIKTNIDPFTQRPIVNEFDPPARQLASMLGYLWNLSMPTPLTSTGLGGKIRDAASGKVDKFGDPASTAGQAALRAVGVNVYPIDPQKTRTQNLQRMRFEISRVKARRTQLLKDKNLTREEKVELGKEYMGVIEERQKQMREYARESTVVPKLR